jgi:hypothetical protein
MTTAGLRVTLKLHRFEVGAAALAALAIGFWAISIELRLRSIGVDSGCITNWLNVGATAPSRCAEPMRAWGAIVAGEGGRVSEVMRILPIAVGLLGGVPIVAREIEGRTSATAWSLNGSRTRWLANQAVPIFAVLVVFLAIAAVPAAILVDHRLDWGEGGAALEFGQSGWPALARGFGAFGLAMLAGVLLGRSLPGLVLGAALCAALILGLGTVRDKWMASQPSAPITVAAPGLTTGFGWLAPDGRNLTIDQGFALVPDAVAAGDGNQRGDSAAWLEEHGYAETQLGIPYSAVDGWAIYDALAFILAGTAAIGATAIFVNRRRPAA